MQNTTDDCWDRGRWIAERRRCWHERDVVVAPGVPAGEHALCVVVELVVEIARAELASTAANSISRLLRRGGGDSPDDEVESILLAETAFY